MLKVKSISKSFRSIKALKKISFRVKKGEVIGLLGPNGAGKSTTMKIITGFIRPDTGDVEFNNLSIGQDRIEFAKNIGYLPEGNPLYEDMMVDEHLVFSAKLKGIKKQTYQKEIPIILKDCDLLKMRKRVIHTLSRGFKQRVGLAVALLGSPQILILDEPTSGLDPNQAENIRNLIKSIKKDKYVIFSTHILTEVSQTADRVVVIHQGKIIATGTEKQLINRYFKATRVEFSATGDIKKMKSALAKVNGIKVVSTKKGKDSTKYSLDVKSSLPIVETLITFASKRKSRVVDIQIHTNSLEDVFKKLTRT